MIDSAAMTASLTTQRCARDAITAATRTRLQNHRGEPGEVALPGGELKTVSRIRPRTTPKW